MNTDAFAPESQLRDIHAETRRTTIGIVLLTLAAFAVGLGLSFFDLAGISLCLTSFDAVYVLYATILASAFLPALGAIHSRRMKAVSAQIGVLTTFTMLTASIVFLWITTLLFGADSVAPGLVFFSRIMRTLSFFVLWQVVLRYFPGKEGSRSRLVITAGFPAAQIAGGCAVPLLVSTYSLESLLPFAALAFSVGALLILTFLNKLGTHESAAVDNCASSQSTNGQGCFTWYTAVPIIGAVVLAALAGHFLSHMYRVTAAAQFADPEQLSRTFARIDVALGIIQILLMTAVAGRLIQRFGPIFGLSALPMLVGVSAAAMMFASRFETNVVFVIALIAWASETICKSSLYNPSMNTLYAALFRPDAQARVFTIVETSARPISGVAGGGLLILLTKCFDCGIHSLAAILLVGVILWVIATAALSSSYQAVTLNCGRQSRDNRRSATSRDGSFDSLISCDSLSVAPA